MALRRLNTNAIFRGAVKCSASYPLESELSERLQALLKLVDEAE